MPVHKVEVRTKPNNISPNKAEKRSKSVIIEGMKDKAYTETDR